jgi:hypothetical protein
MATYVNDLRLKEITTGDESGTWGTSTNTNLELIAEAFSYGTEVITTNADTHTTTIADGATDPGRSLYLKYTGTLDSACTITIGPDTVSKVWIIENGTSGSQNIIISQGSGADITIPAGDTKVVYSDGAGAGAAFFDAFASLSVVDLKVQDDLTVTDDVSIGGKVRVGAATDGTGALMTFDSASNSSSLQMGNNSGGISPGGVLLYSASGNEFQIYQYTGVVGSETYGNPTFALNSIGAATFTPISAGGHAVFNEGGIDADFRVESDTNAHAFYVDGTNGNVGIGSNADYGGKLIVVPATTATTVADAKYFQIGEASLNASYRMQLGYYADPVSSYQSSIQSIAGGNPTNLVLNGDGGNVLVGATSNASNQRLHVESAGTYGQLGLRNSGATAGKFWYVGAQSNNTFLIYNNGVAGVYLTDGATSWAGSSDENLKENIVELTGVLGKVKDFRCVEYNLISDETNSKKIGFIAQDWQEDYSQVVSQDENGNLGMQYTETIPVLLKAIQEQQTLIESLTARITALES